MKALKIATAAALLMIGGAAAAQSASDAQCLILSNAFATQAKDENGKKMAESAFYFYLGRIGPNATSAQLKTLLDQQMKTLNDASAGQQMTDCAKGVATKMAMVQSIAEASKPAAAKPGAAAPSQQQKKPEGR